MIATWQTRIAEYADLDRTAGDAALGAFGELYVRVQRRHSASTTVLRSVPSLKSTYLKCYAIPGRMFNSALPISSDTSPVQGSGF